MVTEFVLLTNAHKGRRTTSNKGCGNNILLSPLDESIKELPAPKVERFFRSLGYHFTDCVNVRQDELQYYIIDVRLPLSYELLDKIFNS